jgi:hypothetical protein
MIHTEPTALVGIFNNHANAERAKEELLRSGARPEAIILETAAGEETALDPKLERGHLRERGNAALGLVIGGVIGALIGTLVATAAIPGIPPLLAGGALAGLIGAVLGFAIGGLIGALVAWGFAADRQSFFAQELQTGRTTLTVREENLPAEAAAIINRNGGWCPADQPTLAQPPHQ